MEKINTFYWANCLRLSLCTLLAFFTSGVKAQDIPYKFAVLTSRVTIAGTDKYKAGAFDKSKGLYPIKTLNTQTGANAVYIKKDNLLKVFYFEKGVPQNVQLRDLNAIESSLTTSRVASTSFTESKEIFFEKTKEEFVTLKNGTYVFKTIAYQGQPVTVFEALLTILPSPYSPDYYDFGSLETTPKKECYNWKTTDREAHLFAQNPVFSDELGVKTAPSIKEVKLIDRETNEAVKIIKTTTATPNSDRTKSSFAMNLYDMFNRTTNRPVFEKEYQIMYSLAKNPQKYYNLRIAFERCLGMDKSQLSSHVRKRDSLIIGETNERGDVITVQPDPTRVRITPEP